MTKFRSRLTFALISLIIIVLLGLGLVLGKIFKDYYLKTFDERLKKESRLVSLYIEEQGGLKSLDRSDIVHLSKMIDERIVISNTSGQIIYDSNGTKAAEQHAIKEKINSIIKNASDSGVRTEQGNGYDIHYYWEPIIHGGVNDGYILLCTETSELNQVYWQLWWLLTISFGIAVVMIIIISIQITSRYIKPVESATNVAIELARGNYRARTSVERMDETGILNSAINILARNLQEMAKSQEMQNDRLTTLIENIGAGLILIDSRGYINLINKGYIDIFEVDPSEYLMQQYYEVIKYPEVRKLVEDIFITEQKVTKQMLLPLSIERRYFDVYGVPIIGTNNVWKGVLLVFHDITEINRLEQMRKDFVANVSHELKTPVTSIKGFTETLLDGALKDQKALESFLSIILKESDRLQSLIQDLLDLSKIEQPDFQLNMEKFDLLSTLKETITMLDNKAADKNIKLSLESRKDNIFLNGDVDRLKQVFINLIANAINYTPDYGLVTVIIEDLKDKVQINVKDTGIGIEKREIPRIFERFYRVDRARSRNSGGTGLGLAIVKHIIEAHRGTIHVNSEVGKGSEFIIQLYKIHDS